MLRAREGISREQLSKMAGISATVLLGYESGKVSPTLPKLFALADFFDVTLDCLTGYKSPSAMTYREDIGTMEKTYKTLKRTGERK